MKLTKNGRFDILLVVCVAAGVFLCSFAGAISLLRRGEALEPPALYAVEPAQQDSYTVKIHNGKLCVFVSDADTPERVLDIDISLLRKDDRSLFEEGITLLSLQELAQLIEDFSG